MKIKQLLFKAPLKNIYIIAEETEEGRLSWKLVSETVSSIDKEHDTLPNLNTRISQKDVELLLEMGKSSQNMVLEEVINRRG